MLLLLAAPLAWGATPRGWRASGLLPWTEVWNTSEWENATYIQDGGNSFNLETQLTVIENSISLVATYDEPPAGTNYSSAYIGIFFTLDNDVCFSADMQWHTIPHGANDAGLPTVYAWCFTDPRYIYLTSQGASSHIQMFISPQICPGYTGLMRMSIENTMNPSTGNFGYGSGSSFRVSNIRMVAGKCRDTQRELIVLLTVLGIFMFVFFALCVGLALIQRKHPQGKPFVMLAAWWHLFNITAQCLFAWSMYRRSFSVSYALSVAFLGMSLLVQNVFACMFMARELRRSEFSVWYYRHRIVCNTIGTSIPALGMHSMAVLHSKVRGWSGFSAPFSMSAVASIKFALLLSAFMQDLPQFILLMVMQERLREVDPIMVVTSITTLSTLIYRVWIWLRYSYKNWALGRVGVSTQRVGAKWGEWVELWDQDSGRWYYENQQTHATSWEQPPGFTAELAKPQEEGLTHALTRKRVVFAFLAGLAFFGLGMAARFHVILGKDEQSFDSQ